MKKLFAATWVLFFVLMAIKSVIAPLILGTPYFLVVGYAAKTSLLYAATIASIFYYKAYIELYNTIIDQLFVHDRAVRLSRN